ncbi:hypothetical protein Cabys_4083 [Caldithrix abyssi DSM 13497]|uniref:Uncharacterized protein n=1 Tax=Caldithrix abyssi DSM 13497 TaxID=880073 RepID=A0A1J1CEJ3_CALAY|nr:hypothetical protein Cabys_4083 [Caldithrix abyssi DSM 13497]
MNWKSKPNNFSALPFSFSNDSSIYHIRGYPFAMQIEVKPITN